MARIAILALLLGCGDGSPHHHATPDASTDAGPDASDATLPRWVGTVGVLVVDEDGTPIEGAFALLGGRPESEWETTGADGRATLEVREMPGTDRWITAGKRGWANAGVELPETPPGSDVVVTLVPLPDEDNVDYPFMEGGYAGHDDEARYCMHCHISIGAGWNESRHHEALSNAHTRDLFNGSALALDETACTDLGGRWEETGVPGSETGELERHCTIGRGVLPDVGGTCGAPGETACDHPTLDRAALPKGSCGDCHGAAIAAATPGNVDLNDAVGATYREGVSCDLCHKIDDVTVGPRPGLDGAIRLRRPSQPSKIASLDFAPIIFGPYPDVVNVFMGASYQPQFRQADLCSACHEYAQAAVDPDDAGLVDPAKWPDGVPVHTTYSEWAASGVSGPCQDCHMPVLHEDSSTFDLASQGIDGSIITGWLRPDGEVRRHDWPSVAALAPTALQADVDLALDGAAVEATVSVRNDGAGHALPTGDPMRQILVLVEATIDGAAVAAVGGRAIPDVGGFARRGVLDTDATVAGRDVTFPAGAGSGDVVRFVRPTGEWDDYDGPGVGWLSDAARTPAEKGLPIFEVLGEVAVSSIAGDVVTLADDPPATLPGDVVYLAGEGEWAGAPGWLYAKVLVDRDGARGVHHYLAIDVASDNRIAAAASARSAHRFPVPAAGSTLRVTARIVHRRQADAVARIYGWAREDLEVRAVSSDFTP